MTAQAFERDESPRLDDAVPAESTLVEAQLVDDRRARAAQRLTVRDRLVSGLGSVLFLAFAVPLALLAPGTWRVGPGIVVLFVVSYAVFSRVEFEVGSGSLVPTQLVLVPMLFVLPPSFVPLTVATGLLLGGLVDQVRYQHHPERLLVMLLYSFHSLGPAVVLVAAGAPRPTWASWWVYCLAFGAQFGLEAASVLAREVFALRVDVRAILGVLPRVSAVDLLLSPVALLAAIAAVDQPLAFLALLPLGLLFHLIGLDRRVGIDRTVELSGAYRSASREARTDGLTGLANRLAWEEHLLEATAPCSVVFIDIDGLKSANDTRGHDFGDRLIREISTVTLSTLGRAPALVARIGGDEFGVLLTGLSGEAAVSRLVDELKEALARHPGLDGRPLTASVGAASWPPQPTLSAALEHADRGLYVAKRELEDRLK